MESKNDPIFILGMFRCRTAWLSACLTMFGAEVTHEGMRDREGFDAWADELDDRLCVGAAGDSDPALVYWIDRLLERWPNARFVVISREDNDSLEALLAASPADRAEQIKAGWSLYLATYKTACDRLRAANAVCRFWSFEGLRNDETVADLIDFATDARPPLDWVRRMQRLKITTTIEDATAPEIAEAKPLQVPSLDHLDTTGLTAALYQNSDFDLISGWWESHTSGRLAQAALPPFGVVVSDAKGPVAAVWAYECFGVPVAELAFPVTRPGLSLKQAATAVSYAVCACVATVGKGHIPEASFRFFKTFAPRPLVRYLRTLGFKEAVTERVAMTLTL